MIGPQDTLIAAIVLQHEGTLMTNPTDLFSRVEGLRVEEGTVGYPQKRASRRDEREKPRPQRSAWLWRCQRFTHRMREALLSIEVIILFRQACAGFSLSFFRFRQAFEMLALFGPENLVSEGDF